jgi:hypothetical protein
MIIGLILVLGFLVFSSVKPGLTPIEPEEVHYHAGFQVYKDNILQDFSGLEYMHIAPCSEDEHEEPHSPEEEQLERAHLHDNIDDVVHVHRDGASWGDLFTNIKVEVNPDKVYINGKLLEKDFLSYPIGVYDSAVIFVGKNTEIEDKLAGAVTKEHITEAENKSESCGS